MTIRDLFLTEKNHPCLQKIAKRVTFLQGLQGPFHRVPAAVVGYGHYGAGAVLAAWQSPGNKPIQEEHLEILLLTCFILYVNQRSLQDLPKCQVSTSF